MKRFYPFALAIFSDEWHATRTTTIKNKIKDKGAWQLFFLSQFFFWYPKKMGSNESGEKNNNAGTWTLSLNKNLSILYEKNNYCWRVIEMNEWFIVKKIFACLRVYPINRIFISMDEQKKLTKSWWFSVFFCCC